MANHASAIKKNRRDMKLRMINRMNMTKMRNKIKLLRKKVSSGEKEEIPQIFRNVVSIIDKTISKGTIHQRSGSRYKSRLSSMIRKAGIEI